MDNDKFQDLVLDYMAKLTQDITGIRQDITSLKQGQVKIELMIENDIKPKINSLFEGQKQHTEQLTRIEVKLDEHDEFILKRIK